jgi:uncharacterized membrane protein YgdD (TMEM256/DUF423 family)
MENTSSIPGIILVAALVIAYAVGFFLRHDGQKRLQKVEFKKEHTSCVYQMWFGMGLMGIAMWGLMDMGISVQSVGITLVGFVGGIYLAFRLLTQYPRFPESE